VIRSRVAAISSARFFSSYFRFGVLSRLISVSPILTDRRERRNVELP
jgi:hypothetical protein